MVRDEEAEVARPYKVDVSGVFREIFYYCNFNVSNSKFNTHARYPKKCLVGVLQ